MASHFKVRPNQPEPTLAERALMYMVGHHEAFKHTVRVSSEEEISFYKIFIP